MPKFFRALLLCLFAGPLAAADTLPPLVDADWLLANGDKEGLVLLDIQPAAYYRQVHLQGAVSAPFKQWRTAAPGGVEGVLPPIPVLEAQLGRLGISPEHHVVIVTTGLGAGDMAAAARVFWTFKVLGHRSVAVLDGGLSAVAENVRGRQWLTDRPVSRPETRYQARPELALLADTAQTLEAQRRGDLLVDARSAGEYLGIHSGGEGERPGTLPQARNLPFDWLTDNGSGRLLPVARMRALLAAVEIDADTPQVHFCHSGNRAALTWFAAYALLGNQQARLYDASMLEWSVRGDLPMERRVRF